MKKNRAIGIAVFTLAMGAGLAVTYQNCGQQAGAGGPYDQTLSKIGLTPVPTVTNVTTAPASQTLSFIATPQGATIHLEWHYPTANCMYIQIRFGSPSGPLLVQFSQDGTADFTKVQNGSVFYLQDECQGPVDADKNGIVDYMQADHTVATVTVTGQNQ